MADRARIRVWHRDGDEWRCVHCGRHLATLHGDTYTTPAGLGGALPATLRCKCGTVNRCERVIVKTEYQFS